MGEDHIEVIDGPFAGYSGTVLSRSDDRLTVQVTVLGELTTVDLWADQVHRPDSGNPAAESVAAVRDQIVAEHDRLPETEAFALFLERFNAPETDLAAEWDAYVARRAEMRGRAEERKQAALDRFDREIAAMPAEEARRVIADDRGFWLPDTVAAAAQLVAFPEPAEPTAEQRLLAAIFDEEREDPPSPRQRAKERLDRARSAAEERDYERWEANRSDDERRALPTRGNPGRYAYARAAHAEVSLPPERSVEMAIRSTAGVGDGPIPQKALEAVDGLRLDLNRPADLTPLGQLPNLRWLSVHSTVPVDLVTLAAALRPARWLRSLTIEAPVDDITPLAQLTQVTHLWLDHTKITDLSPLAGLRHLDDLSVCDGPLEDLTALSGLTLGRLFVYRTRVRDLSPLAGMATLQVLGLAGCPVRDLSVVTTLPTLHFVNLHGTAVTDLGNLRDRAPRVTFEGVGAHHTGPADAATGEPAGGGPTAPLADERAAALLAEFAAAGDDHARKGRLERAMLAGRRLDLVQQIISADIDAARSTVVGLLLRGGVGDAGFAINPWRIPSDAGLTEALDRVWAPVAEFAPRFVAAVHNRTFGLALLAEEDGGAALAYLAWHHDDNSSGRRLNPPTSLDQFADPAKDYHLAVIVGNAPHIADPTAVVPVLAGPVPRPIRDFWAVHHSLRGWLDSIGGDLSYNTLEFLDKPWRDVTERLGGLPPDRFVHSAGRANYDDYVLDLDVLDSAGNPTVARWAFKEWHLGDHKQYWDWFDSTGIELIFGH